MGNLPKREGTIQRKQERKEIKRENKIEEKGKEREEKRDEEIREIGRDQLAQEEKGKKKKGGRGHAGSI